jgi:hypothetical protein
MLPFFQTFKVVICFFSSGAQVTNYHVVAKLATDTSGLQRCKVFPCADNSIKLLILDGRNICNIGVYTSICRFS